MNEIWKPTRLQLHQHPTSIQCVLYSTVCSTSTYTYMSWPLVVMTQVSINQSGQKYPKIPSSSCTYHHNWLVSHWSVASCKHPCISEHKQSTTNFLSCWCPYVCHLIIQITCVFTNHFVYKAKRWVAIQRSCRDMCYCIPKQTFFSLASILLYNLITCTETRGLSASTPIQAL